MVLNKNKYYISHIKIKYAIYQDINTKNTFSKIFYFLPFFLFIYFPNPQSPIPNPQSPIPIKLI